MSPSRIDDTVTEHERWTSAAGKYQERIGKTTLVGTERLVEIVNDLSPFNPESYALDNGTGGGSLAIKIKEKSSSTKVLATDLSTGMLEQVDSLHLPNVSTQREDAVTLSGLKDDSFTHVLTSFMIQFTPDQPATVDSMYRVLAPGGIAGIAIWGPHADVEEIHRRGCHKLKPSYEPASPISSGNVWRSEEDHHKALEKAGFKNVHVETVWMPFECHSAQHFIDYWFGFGNPVPRQMLEHWTAAGGDVEELKNERRKIAKEEYDDGAKIRFDAVLGWGTK